MGVQTKPVHGADFCGPAKPVHFLVFFCQFYGPACISHFSEVTADRHKLMIPRHIMWPAPVNNWTCDAASKYITAPSATLGIHPTA